MTEEPRTSRRVHLAERIFAACAGRADGREVFREFRGEDYRDPVLEELLDLFEHQPAKSRLWGLSGAKYDEYIARMQALAAAIVADPHRVPQTDGP
jgi:hypothetical protein